MKRSDRNRLRMYLAVQTTCNKHQEVWKDVKVFADVFGKFNSKLEEISTEIKVQQSITTGVRKKKQALKKDLSRQSQTLIGSIRVYAEKEENYELLDKISKSISVIYQDRDADTLQFCETILETAIQLQAELTDIGLDPVVIQEFQETVTEYSGLISSPRIAISRRKVAGIKLNKLFRETSKLLDQQLDPLMEQFQGNGSNFYEEYFSNRIIINLRRSSNSGTVAAGEDGFTDEDSDADEYPSDESSSADGGDLL